MMLSPPHSASEIDKARRHLRSAGKLHLAHWVIIGLSTLIALTAWQYSKSLIAEQSRLQFNRQADHTIELMQERLDHYEIALWAGTAAILANGGKMSRKQWRTYTEQLDINKRYPGIGGIGVIHHVPQQALPDFVEMHRAELPSFNVFPVFDTEVHLPILYVEPESSNAAAIGLDVAFETNRREAALKARSLGVSQISGPITLVQDEGKTPGFLFYAPYYLGPRKEVRDTEQSSFTGFVYAPMIVKNLVEGAVAQHRRDVALRISDGDTVLYDEHDPSEQGQSSSAQFQRMQTVDLYGRQWQFDIRSTPAFHGSTQNALPSFILMGGLLIDAMLLLLFLSSCKANRMAMALADSMTVRLEENAVDLNEKNIQLTSFAHVVAHDLKTPNRGVHDLVQFIEEDLEWYLESDDASPSVKRNIDRLYQQVRRTDILINGILAYSGLGVREDTTERVDTAEVITEIAELSRIRKDQLVVEGEAPVFDTLSIHLGQVLANLIGNSFKYHHDLDNAVTIVRIEECSRFYHFSIIDNGPGIDPVFHERIFEPFKTLQSKDDIESSGIGLAIVKRSVERIGGKINVESTPGAGSTFTFTWPKQIVIDEHCLAVKAA